METLWQDVRYGIRMLLKNPGFTAVAVLTLALGIGANTAIFPLTDQILLRLLPVDNPEELVVLRSPGPMRGHVSGDGDNAESFSYPMYKDLRDHSTVFRGLLARFTIPLSVAGQGRTERADGELVSGNYFEVLGVPAALGRTFTQADDHTPGAHPMVVLSYGYWTRRFGADSGILNQTLLVNGNSMTVIGVTHAGFNGVQIGQKPDIFIPITMKAQMTPHWDGLDNRQDYWLKILGRLKPGITSTRAETGIAPTYRALLEQEVSRVGWTGEKRERFLNKKILLDPGARGRQILQRDAQTPLLLLTGMVGLVLLIACANVASLLIARSAARQREIAVRLALGAGRWDLVRQLLVESLLLSLVGGAAGLIIAYWLIDALIAWVSTGVGVDGLSSALDLRLLGFAFGLSVFTGVLFGLATALRASRPDLTTALKDQASNLSAGLRHVWFRKGLVAAQMSLTLLLLIGAGVFARSLHNLKNVDLGLRVDHLLSFSIAPELIGYTPVRSVALFDQLREAVAVLPGVRSVSTAEIPPFTDSNNGSNITIEGYHAPEDEGIQVLKNWVGPGYFSTMKIPLLAGREFADADTTASPKVVVINETMVRRYFAGRNPVGSHIAWGAGNDVHPDIQIVGVVKDSKHSTVRQEAAPFVYIPYAQDLDLGRITFYVRTQQDSVTLAAAMRNEVQKRDASLPVFDLKTVETQINEQLFGERFVTILSVAFGLLAAVLASVGLYGVMAYIVTRRTREIGIRVALGAGQSDVRWMILREVMFIVAVGLVIGLPTALTLGRFAESLLFGVKASDPLMMMAAVSLLTVVALLAGYLPARRAARMDPMVALRYE